MTGWRVPVAAAAFAAGLLAWPVAGGALPVWAWLGLAGVGLALGTLLAPGAATSPDALEAAGLISARRIGPVDELVPSRLVTGGARKSVV